jgi:hypothetical protein
METRILQSRTHQKNIDRYEGLLEAKCEKRLSEERLAIATLQFTSGPREHDLPGTLK